MMTLTRNVFCANRKRMYLLLAISGSIALGSCKSDKTYQLENRLLQYQIDSLTQANELQKTDLDNMHSFMSVISDGLDSIALQEHHILVKRDVEGRRLTKHELKRRLDDFADLLARQRERIAQLEDSLTFSNSESMGKLRNIINYLNQQMDSKDKTIASLQAELKKKNVDIGRLNSMVNTLTEENTTLTTIVEKQEEALTVQTEIINECYVKIGSRKELQQSGLLKGGFLSKKKVNYDGVDKRTFNAVDIRQFREVQLKSSDPKILTPVPNNNSFYFEDNGDGTCTLHITNPTLFWSVSNFLIIQL